MTEEGTKEDEEIQEKDEEVASFADVSDDCYRAMVRSAIRTRQEQEVRFWNLLTEVQ